MHSAITFDTQFKTALTVLHSSRAITLLAQSLGDFKFQLLIMIDSVKNDIILLSY